MSPPKDTGKLGGTKFPNFLKSSQWTWTLVFLIDSPALYHGATVTHLPIMQYYTYSLVLNVTHIKIAVTIVVFHQDPQSETFQGFIRVHLNLIRPINMSVSGRPPSFYEVLTHEDEGEEEEHITSFYLPKNTTKVVHISR